MRACNRWTLSLAWMATWVLLGCLPDRKDVSALLESSADGAASQDSASDTAAAPGSCGDGKLQGSEQCDSPGANWCSGCDKCEVRNTWKVAGEADLATAAAKDGLAKTWVNAGSGFSVELWFKPQQLPGPNDSAAMLAVTGLLPSAPAFVVALARDQVKGSVYATCAYLPKQSDPGNGLFLQGGDAIKVGAWHHLRCAWVPGEKVMKLSQDGDAPVQTAKVTGQPQLMFDATSWLTVGSIPLEAGKPGFVGELDELRVLTGTSSANFSEFQARYSGEGADTELLLHMDQATGATRLSDSSKKQVDLRQSSKGPVGYNFETAQLSFLPEACYGMTEAQIKCKPAGQPKPPFCQ